MLTRCTVGYTCSPSSYVVLNAIQYPDKDVAEYHYLYAYCLRRYLDLGDTDIDKKVEARDHFSKCVELHPRKPEYVEEMRTMYGMTLSVD